MDIVGDIGIPVYLDPFDRGVVDFNHEGVQIGREWHPMNKAASQLCRCYVALGDLEEAIEHCLSTKDQKKRRRRLRAASVPLHNLCVAIVDAINAIQSDSTRHSHLPVTAPKDLTAMRSRFVHLVPFDRKGKLGILRNRISAHLDSGESPSEMREIAKSVDGTEFGEWINICAATLCDLLKLDAYMWTTDGPQEGLTTIMCQEPIMTVLRIEEQRAVGIEGFFASKRSPKHDVLNRIQILCSLAQNLFERRSRFEIRGFYEDDAKRGWSSLLRDLPAMTGKGE